MTCGYQIVWCRTEHKFWLVSNQYLTRIYWEGIRFCCWKAPVQAFILLLLSFSYSYRLKSKSSDSAPGFSLSEDIWEIFSFQILRFCWILNISLLGIQNGISKCGIWTALIPGALAIAPPQLSPLDLVFPTYRRKTWECVKMRQVA